jgi:hypothetical protein
MALTQIRCYNIAVFSRWKKEKKRKRNNPNYTGFASTTSGLIGDI